MPKEYAFKHPIEGQTYNFHTDLKYTKQHNGQDVTVLSRGDLVSLVRREDTGVQFAAFNDELHRDAPRSNPSEGSQTYY